MGNEESRGLSVAYARRKTRLGRNALDCGPMRVVAVVVAGPETAMCFFGSFWPFP